MNPAWPSNCGENDNVSDTPPTEGWTSCSRNGATCGSSWTTWRTTWSTATAAKMFTNGQKTRMLAALNSSTAERNNLWQPSNLLPPARPTRSALRCGFQLRSHGDLRRRAGAVQRQSYHGATHGSGPSPAARRPARTDENPVVTYDTPGVYAVTSTAATATDTVSTPQSDYIVVLAPPGTPAPYTEDFEDPVQRDPRNEWTVNERGRR